MLARNSLNPVIASIAKLAMTNGRLVFEGLDAPALAAQEGIRDEAKRAEIDLTAACADKIGETRVETGIFMRA